MSKREPERLTRGKAFHKKVQAEWEDEAEGDISVEHGITKPSGRKGRIDIHVSDESDMVAVCEIKASDWDRMKPSAVRRNVRRQIKQIWDYVEAELKDKVVCPGVIFPARPTTLGRIEEIESLFNDEGIQVVWEDEPVDQLQNRMRD